LEQQLLLLAKQVGLSLQCLLLQVDHDCSCMLALLGLLLLLQVKQGVLHCCARLLFCCCLLH
jgi:hypothetical protein